jgi:hypothetical protein
MTDSPWARLGRRQHLRALPLQRDVRPVGERGAISMPTPRIFHSRFSAQGKQGFLRELKSQRNRCYYFGESLTEELGAAAPPLGRRGLGISAAQQRSERSIEQ